MQTDQLASQISDVPVIATTPKAHPLARGIGFAALSLGGSLGVGAGVAALTRSRRSGLVSGGFATLAAAALRWQLQRWFTDEPSYEIERRIGALEIRRYEPRVEAHVRVTTVDFEDALAQGYRTLASYIRGHNVRGESLARTVPVLMHPRATTHTLAFIMPPGRTRSSLPTPDDHAVRLVEQPVRRIAALGYRGRYTNANFQEAQEELHELVAAAGLDAAGEPTFAGFDPPTTLPVLRRCEVWIELG